MPRFNLGLKRYVFKIGLLVLSVTASLVLDYELNGATWTITTGAHWTITRTSYGVNNPSPRPCYEIMPPAAPAEFLRASGTVSPVHGSDLVATLFEEHKADVLDGFRTEFDAEFLAWIRELIPIDDRAAFRRQHGEDIYVRAVIACRAEYEPIVLSCYRATLMAFHQNGDTRETFNARFVARQDEFRSNMLGCVRSYRTDGARAIVRGLVSVGFPEAYIPDPRTVTAYDQSTPR